MTLRNYLLSKLVDEIPMEVKVGAVCCTILFVATQDIIEKVQKKKDENLAE